MTAAEPVGVPLPIRSPGAVDAEPADPGGYGRFRWGDGVEAVRAIEPKLAAFAAAEPVAFEAEALARIHDAARDAAKAEGRAAYKAFRAREAPRPRLSAHRYWISLAGLPGRVELRFVDDRLYEVIVRVLYREKQKPAAARILDGLVEKYGAPLDPESGHAPPEARPRLDFAIPGGRLRVLRRRVAPDEPRGMLRLHYAHTGLAEGVERYLQGLRGRLSTLETAEAPAAPPPKPAAPDPLLQHL